MLETTVSELCRATGATLLCGSPSIPLRGVTTDSRAVVEGGLFVCFPGERVDGNDFAAAALDAGAAAVVLTRPATDALRRRALAAGSALVRAEGDDPEKLMLRLAALWRARNPQWTLIGVTGSVGKTTTKDMLARALSRRFAVHATKGNFNNLLGLPLTILSASPEDEVLVCEMGMNHAGELARLSTCARPDLALVTNVGTSHIGLLGSRENIARAKAEILVGMRPSDDAAGRAPSRLVLGVDNDFAALIEGDYARPAGVRVAYVGDRDDALTHAERLSLDDQGRATFDLVCADGWRQRVTLGVPGRHVVSDVLMAMAMVVLLGVDRAEALDAIASMPQTSMRLELRSRPGKARVIDDSYNASPNSMAAALDVLRSMDCAGRRVAVLGEMAELGDEADRLHDYVGAYAAAANPDLLVLVGGRLASRMADAALTMGFSPDRLERAGDVDEVSRVIAPVLVEGDLVLVKASRSAGLDAFVREVLA
ncbi:UDP-N-acetylmuramoyl-tripeptide--D-alanyl-D-alanine ligase [Olsenella sp. HMSC062G07]|uniref:UDP-N-acetylmuramoyl-tripeptide--D-alanyl-D- alanine ligase n=2 Tax=Olsenella TaxID=133925 RepID=UPI0008A4CFE8|nr:UDP-N-acetylmuramoyl-tripeptide--D-alanyl-D-alanine ligase [Olsenella sp. HMSC062G07]OFK24869.1 UDP-N-acetylmuramoylalanyl-D-glutamyl-2, 6-diaminopimelate--D-alanyl-D-alanine ligase [Olsenella sp. HMSC062G07]